MPKAPNILLFMVDELRYPTVYDGPELRAWMAENLVAQRLFRERGLEFHRHYVQSSACAPSRTSIFTGQYPTLHGVSQTDGMGKTAWDPGMSWLDPNTVPTMGDWFRAAGYRTYYKGKWHISHADIEIPGKHDSLMSNLDDGTPIPRNVEAYKAADRLNDFGFSGWIGPEPHGQAKANSGWIRDPGYKHQGLSLIDDLEAGGDDQPWLLVNSFVNPHDIVFFGLFWAAPPPMGFGLKYPTPEEVPQIPPPPTANENLSTKPAAQASYVAAYPQMFLPQPTIELYRRFYYYLQIDVEKYIKEVYQRLETSRFFENTIVVFTTDHGDMLGAHGGMHQKWYNAYEETIHVPLIITSPLFGNTPRSESGLTSHADLLPTLLGLAGVDVDQAAKKLALSHNETRPLVGRDLSGVVRGTSTLPNDPVFFMTYDDVSQGLSQVAGNRQWQSVTTPNQVESIVAQLGETLWKYTIYTQQYDTPYAGLLTNPNLLSHRRTCRRSTSSTTSPPTRSSNSISHLRNSKRRRLKTCGRSTRRSPFRTLRRAQEALRGGSDSTVYLANGTYRLDDPLRFDSSQFGPDGPRVTFRATPGATPVISGAVKVEGWTLHDPSLNIDRAKVAHRSRQLCTTRAHGRSRSSTTRVTRAGWMR